MNRQQAICLAVFDLDGTLLREETVCQVIARQLGREARMQQLESNVNVSDLKPAREEIVSWYEGYSQLELCSYLRQAKLAPGAAEAFQRLRKAGVTLALASLTWGFAVEWFARRLGVSHWLGTEVRLDWTMTHCFPDDKAAWVRRLRKTAGLSRAEVAVIGDSQWDVPMLHEGGLSIFVGKKECDGLPPGTIELPDADLRVVADLVLGEDAVKSRV